MYIFCVGNIHNQIIYIHNKRKALNINIVIIQKNFREKPNY